MFKPFKKFLQERKPPRLKPTQDWGDVQEGETMDEYYDRVREYAREAWDDFNRLLQRVSRQGEDKVIIDIKSRRSFVDKVINRGKNPKKIHDILRGTIVCKDEENVEDVVENFHRDAIIFEYEYKEYDENDPYGYYGSHHFKIEVGEPGKALIAEVQVMHRRLWHYKKEAHKIYSRTRGKSIDEIDPRKLRRSRNLYWMANELDF